MLLWYGYLCSVIACFRDLQTTKWCVVLCA
jgi:hypothetical protein